MRRVVMARPLREEKVVYSPPATWAPQTQQPARGRGCELPVAGQVGGHDFSAAYRHCDRF